MASVVTALQIARHTGSSSAESASLLGCEDVSQAIVDIVKTSEKNRALPHSSEGTPGRVSDMPRMRGRTPVDMFIDGRINLLASTDPSIMPSVDDPLPPEHRKLLLKLISQPLVSVTV